MNPSLIEQYWSHLAAPDEHGRARASHKNIQGLKTAHQFRQHCALEWSRFWNYFIAQEAQYWIWSDLHLGHQNIISYCNRPFSNSHEMNEHLVSHAILKVKPDDYVLFLGDISFLSPPETKAWLNAMPGRKFLIAGNHDLKKGQWLAEYESIFEGISAFEMVTLQQHRIAFSHYPLDLERFKDVDINVHGHTHNEPSKSPKHVNVCVEHLNYEPQALRPLLLNQLGALYPN